MAIDKYQLCVWMVSVYDTFISIHIWPLNLQSVMATNMCTWCTACMSWWHILCHGVKHHKINIKVISSCFWIDVIKSARPPMIKLLHYSGCLRVTMWQYWICQSRLSCLDHFKRLDQAEASQHELDTEDMSSKSTDVHQSNMLDWIMDNLDPLQ